MADFDAVWAALTANPVFGLGLTCGVFWAASALHRRLGSFPLLNPVLVSIASLIGLLTLLGVPYPDYFNGARLVHFLLGPATVALAVPLYRQLGPIRRFFLPILASLVVGCLTAVLSALALAKLSGASPATLLSVSPKSVTMPIALGVSECVGGMPAITAIVVVVTGIFGAVFAPALFTRLGIRSPMARGFALGLAAHGLGTARALEESEEAGAFSALALGLNGLLTAVLLPLILPWLLTNWFA